MRNEFHDTMSFRELFPYYSVFEYVFYGFEAVSDPSFFVAPHDTIVSSLTRIIDFASATLFCSQFLYVTVNEFRKDSIH